jgi:hypothetical protein
LFRDQRHLLQKLLILLISAVGGQSTRDYIYRSLGKYDFMNAKTWFGMDFAKCLT